MQALFFFALFGLLAAVVSGIMALGSVTAQKFRLLLIDETHRQFITVSTVINEQYVPDNLQSPPTFPANSSTDVGPYLCLMQAVRQVLDCTRGYAVDAWGHTVTGKAVRVNQSLLTQNGLMFSVPVTGYAVLSAGPDGKIDTTIPANPVALNQITVLSPQGDDILHVFSDLPAQQNNAHAIEVATQRIALAAQRQYRQQFSQFQPQVAQAYAASAANTTDFTSPVVQNSWKVWTDASHPAPTLPANPNDPTQVNTYLSQLSSYKNTLANYPTPSFVKLFSSGTFNPYAIGADGDLEAIQRILPTGYGLTLGAIVSDSNPLSYGVNDTLLLTVTNGHPGTAWQQAVTPNCTATPPVNCVQVKGSVQ